MKSLNGLWLLPKASLCVPLLVSFSFTHFAVGSGYPNGVCRCRSVAQSCPILCHPTDCSTPGFPVLHYLPKPCSDSRPSSRCCQPTISSSVTSLLLLPSIFPSIRVFSNESALRIRWAKYWSFSFSSSPFNEYSRLISFRLTGLISLQSKGLSRVSSNTTVQKHRFFSVQPCIWSNSHICT